MDNYKIKVKDKAESKEAQELFFELGAVWSQSKKATFNSEPMSFIYFNGSTIYYGHDDENDDGWFNCEESGKELTLPQLRDLVVLKRNDVKDANYRSTKVSDGLYFKTCDGKFYFMFEGTWVLSEIRTDEGLKPITQDQGLISGDDAKLAWANGQDVQTATLPILHEQSCWINLPGGFGLDVFDNSKDRVFRLKPQTIKLELEIPAPFEPKHGEMYWWIDATSEEGYSYTYFDNNKADQDIMQFGAYRTEEDVKQVVEQLRKLRGNNS